MAQLVYTSVSESGLLLMYGCDIGVCDMTITILFFVILTLLNVHYTCGINTEATWRSRTGVILG